MRTLKNTLQTHGLLLVYQVYISASSIYLSLQTPSFPTNPSITNEFLPPVHLFRRYLCRRSCASGLMPSLQRVRSVQMCTREVFLRIRPAGKAVDYSRLSRMQNVLTRIPQRIHTLWFTSKFYVWWIRCAQFPKVVTTRPLVYSFILERNHSGLLILVVSPLRGLPRPVYFLYFLFYVDIATQNSAVEVQKRIE